MLRKYTKNKTVIQLMTLSKSYLSIQEITKKWSMPVRDWGIIGQLMIFLRTDFSHWF